MIKPELRGKIIKIEQFIDDSTVFEQNIFFQLPDGTIIKIFDYNLLAKREMVGKDIVISIFAFLNTIEYCHEGKYGIKPVNNASNDLGKLTNSNVFYGKLIEVDRNWEHIYNVDIGMGTIEADKDMLGKKFSVGDWLKIIANRTDLNKINVI
jgi:hypothetical protein